MKKDKKIILCADDYAQNTAISDALIHLASKRRINAISCMVNSPIWPSVQSNLLGIKSSTYIGLHLNLTVGQPMSVAWKRVYGSRFSGLPRLISKAYLGLLDVDIVMAEIQAQVDAFAQAMNVYPDFIDGHEHCHQLPIVRKGLLPIVSKIELQHPIFVRSTSAGWRDCLSGYDFPKRQLISLLGGIALKNELNQTKIATNSSFAGIYNLKKSQSYSYYFNSFLSNIQNGGLIMCHPGNPSMDPDDPQAGYRHYELNYFDSDAYLSDLNLHGVTLMQKGELVNAV